MTTIAIYIEGGGDTANTKAQLRLGLDALLTPQKNAARKKRLGWKLVLCGGRDVTFKAFQHATKVAKSEIVVLLVDAEEAVKTANATGRVAHLAKRDQWDMTGVTAEHVHLMIQCMEAWIVADPAALEAYYGKEFNPKVLPKRTALDDEPKKDIYAALEAATKATQKGCYGKIKHASDLLSRLNTTTVAQRCASFQQFTQWLDATIEGAS